MNEEPPTRFIKTFACSRIERITPHGTRVASHCEMCILRYRFIWRQARCLPVVFPNHGCTPPLSTRMQCRSLRGPPLCLAVPFLFHVRSEHLLQDRIGNEYRLVPDHYAHSPFTERGVGDAHRFPSPKRGSNEKVTQEETSTILRCPQARTKRSEAGGNVRLGQTALR